MQHPRLTASLSEFYEILVSAAAGWVGAGCDKLNLPSLVPLSPFIMFSIFLMSLLRAGRGEEPGSDLTLPLPGLTAREGGGELLWGGDTGGLPPEESSGGVILLPAPRALNAEAMPDVSGDEDMEEVGEEYGENLFCFNLSEIMLAWLL